LKLGEKGGEGGQRESREKIGLHCFTKSSRVWGAVRKRGGGGKREEGGEDEKGPELEERKKEGSMRRTSFAEPG